MKRIFPIHYMLQLLGVNGYSSTGLLDTSDYGNPILCANCHASNALGKAGINGIKPLTESVHSWHGLNVMDDNTGLPLDNTMNRSACYYCHPGSQTQCLRGVMGKAKKANGNSLLQCQSCHGSMLKVGAPGRTGWIDLPSCHYCHYLSDATGSYVRDTSVFDPSGNYRQVTSIFTTGPSLYKVSAGGHGNMQCEACHGSTHAEYATSEANDNVQSIIFQGHKGTIAECSVCHRSFSLPITKDGGPHGLHTIGQAWVNNHHGFAADNLTQCATCHGNNYRGTILSKTFTGRTFTTKGSGLKRYVKGTKVSCYDCHKG